ncbi:MAG: DUF3168 domain-containing protein [Burkholderiaceae bacterium]
MSIEADLRNCLLPLAGGRVYFDVVPLEVIQAGVWPAIRLSTPAVTPDNTICGSSDLDDYRWQIDLYAPSTSSIAALRPQVFAAIEAEFPHAERISDMSDYDSELKLRRRIIEYGIRAE